jgi:hypothetical protein
MAFISGNITTTNGVVAFQTDSSATGSTQSGAVCINLTGTFSGTVTFQASPDGVNWFGVAAYPVLTAGIPGAPVLTATAVGTFVIPVYGYQSIRAIATTYTSGTIAVAIDGAYSGPLGNISVNTEGLKPSYAATTAVFSPGTAATTTIAQIVGSATKTIRVTRVVLSASIATTAENYGVTLTKRSTAASGGVAVAATVCPLDSNNAAGTAVVNSYTTTPTAGTSVGIVAGGNYFANVPPAQCGAPLIFDFGGRPSQCPVLRGVAQSLDVTLSLATPGHAGSWQVTFEWTEE